MVESIENCETCEYLAYMIDRYGPTMSDMALQLMVERQQTHLELTHGKFQDGVGQRRNNGETGTTGSSTERMR